MMRLLTACLVVSLVACAVSAAPVQVTVTEFPDAVSVVVHDLDLLRAAHKALSAEVRLKGVAGVYKADLMADYQPAAIVVLKANDTMCGEATVVIRDGEQDVFSGTLKATIVAEPKGLPTTGAKAYIESGQAMKEAPTVMQPDFSKLRTLALPKAERKLEVGAIAAKVESDINFPLISANNNCPISRQTAHPDDPALRSVYVPLKSQIYDKDTGRPSRVAHYIAEIPLDPAWIEGEDDATIVLGPEDIKVHTTDKKWPEGATNAQFITGQGAGGLGQLVGSTAVDKDGNVYYSASMMSHIVRFNVAKGEFEAPPIDIVKLMNQYLPKKEDLPEDLREKGSRWDIYGYVVIGDGRLFYSPVRYANYGQVYVNGVFSFPLEHWYDAEKFAEGARFLAGCWPTAPMALHKVWPKKGDPSRSIAPGYLLNNAYTFRAYGRAEGGPWRIELNPDGSSKAITTPKEDNIRKEWSLVTPRPRVNASGAINWWDYGTLTTSRANLADTLAATVGAKPKGNLTICYDAVAAMRAKPERYADILNNLEGPSLAPCYMAIGIPEKPGHILGVGEYGYYLADIDLTTAAEGKVRKDYLRLDTGDTAIRLPVKVGLGPYGRIWWRNGNKRELVMTGYTGIVKMVYSVDGKPLERFDSEPVRGGQRSGDGAPAGGSKWSRHPVAGMDGRVYLCATHNADRGGSPYSNGLIAFKPDDMEGYTQFSRMSRGSNTILLCSRILFESDGRKRQQLALVAGQSNAKYLTMLGDKDAPGNTDAKVLLYEAVEGGEPTDVLGFSAPVVDGKSGISELTFSADGRYLVSVQHGAVLTFDLSTWRYVDGAKLEAKAWEFARPDHCLNVAPDGRIFACLQEKGAAEATFCEVVISPHGAVSLKPHLTLVAPNAANLRSLEEGVIAFAADPKGDGSYDLCMGPYWRHVSSTLWVVPDFIAPRK